MPRLVTCHRNESLAMEMPCSPQVSALRSSAVSSAESGPENHMLRTSFCKETKCTNQKPLHGSVIWVCECEGQKDTLTNAWIHPLHPPCLCFRSIAGLSLKKPSSKLPEEIDQVNQVPSQLAQSLGNFSASRRGCLVPKNLSWNSLNLRLTCLLEWDKGQTMVLMSCFQSPFHQWGWWLWNFKGVGTGTLKTFSLLQPFGRSPKNEHFEHLKYCGILTFILAVLRLAVPWLKGKQGHTPKALVFRAVNFFRLQKKWAFAQFCGLVHFAAHVHSPVNDRTLSWNRNSNG